MKAIHPWIVVETNDSTGRLGNSQSVTLYDLIIAKSDADSLSFKIVVSEYFSHPICLLLTDACVIVSVVLSTKTERVC